MKKSTTEEFIQKARIIHKDYYDYSKTEYLGRHKPITIICPVHGEFVQEAGAHLRGSGCIKCNYKHCTTEQFIEKAKKVHGNKYDYSLVDYKNSYKRVNIICPEHGVFSQLPYKHLDNHGCPICGMSSALGRVPSKGEQYIYDWLLQNNIDFKYQVSIIMPEKIKKTNVIVADFQVTQNNKVYIIEYNGSQHYIYNRFYYSNPKDFVLQQYRDNKLEEYCNNNSYNFIVFDYKQSFDEISQILQSTFVVDN